MKNFIPRVLIQDQIYLTRKIIEMTSQNLCVSYYNQFNKLMKINKIIAIKWNKKEIKLKLLKLNLTKWNEL